MVTEPKGLRPRRRSQVGPWRGSDLSRSSMLIAATTMLVIGGGAAAHAEPGQAPEPSHVLSLLLPHEPGKALCFVSSGDPVTYELEDHPKAATPRTATINRFVF